MKKKAVIVTLMILTLLSGCSSEEPPDLMKEKKETVVSMYTNLTNEYNKIMEEYNTLQTKMNEIYEDKQLNPGVTSVGDGSGNLTTHSVNEKIEFNSELSYPNASNIEASSCISVTSNVKLVARDNWTNRLYNSSIELEHSSGISGTISVQKINEYITDGNMKDNVLTPWISEVTTQPVQYNNIFISGNVLGYQGISDVLVNETDKAILTCGITGNNNTSITYVFVYSGERDSVKDELIKNIIESVTIDDVGLKLE